MDAPDTSLSAVADSLLEVWFLCVCLAVMMTLLGCWGSNGSEDSAELCLEIACVGVGECVGVAGEGDLGKPLCEKRNNTDIISSQTRNTRVGVREGTMMITQHHLSMCVCTYCTYACSVIIYLVQCHVLGWQTESSLSDY